ncbi:MAG TPA: hypothetical protein QF446_03160, partial [Planctomycetota bacterium]|nr:hypothetical protein [Planctomycetota bacterium]
MVQWQMRVSALHATYPALHSLLSKEARSRRHRCWNQTVFSWPLRCPIGIAMGDTREFEYDRLRGIYIEPAKGKGRRVYRNSADSPSVKFEVAVGLESVNQNWKFQ